MALIASTGLRNTLLSGSSLKAALDGGFIKIYSIDNVANIPATADAAIPGGATLLCTISVNSTGTGVNFDTAAVAGVLSKAPAEVWSGAVIPAGGTAAFYRHVATGDSGASSTSQVRLQGLVNTFNAEMNLSSVALTGSSTQTIDYYSVTLPSL